MLGIRLWWIRGGLDSWLGQNTDIGQVQVIHAKLSYHMSTLSSLVTPHKKGIMLLLDSICICNTNPT